MLKQANLSFSVTAQANGNETNAIQFSTQDKKTAKLIFTIKEGKLPLNLTDIDGEITLVMQDKSRFVGKAEVTKPLDGVLEYTLTQEQIRHAGRAQGEIILKAVDGSSVGGFRFTFTIKKALVDEDLGPVKEFYIQDLEAVKQDIKKRADAAASDINNLKNELETIAGTLEEEYQNKAYTVDEKLADVQKTVTDLRENGTGIDAQARQEVEQVSVKLEKNTMHQEYKAVNVRDDFGTTSTDIVQAIQYAKTKGNTIELFPAIYTIDQTVIFDNVKVISHHDAILKATSDVNVIQIGTNFILDGKLEVNTKGVAGFTKAACFVTGGTGGQMGIEHLSIIEKIILNGTPSQGVGLHVFSDSVQNFVSFVSFNELFIRGFNKQIKFESRGDGWVTGNSFNKLTMFQGDINMSFEALGTFKIGSNTFNSIIIQNSANSLMALKADRITNNFFNSIVVFDWRWDKKAIELGEASERNHILTSLLPVTIQDLGTRNSIRTLYAPINNQETILPGNKEKPSYLPSDNFLSYSDKRFTVVKVSGDDPTVGEVRHMFDNTYRQICRFVGTDVLPVSYEITLNKAVSYIDVLGVNFLNGNIPTGVKIETYSGTMWTTRLDLTNNKKTSVLFDSINGSPLTSVSKVRFTFSGVGNVDVQNIFGFSSDDVLGRVYLDRLGGDVYGNITYSQGNGPIVRAPNGARYRIGVANDGSLTATYI